MSDGGRGGGEAIFGGVIQILLPRLVSGPSFFRFENKWLKEEGFKDIVKSLQVDLNVRESTKLAD